MSHDRYAQISYSVMIDYAVKTRHQKHADTDTVQSSCTNPNLTIFRTNFCPEATKDSLRQDIFNFRKDRTMTEDMLHVMEWHNGEKDYSPFSDAEMKRRQGDVRKWMATNNVDAALFTSYHCINYYSGWLYCYFGRKYGMVITQDTATTISAGIDGGQPWRRTFGGRNVTYTDWQKDNYFHAIRQIIGGARRIVLGPGREQPAEPCDGRALAHRQLLVAGAAVHAQREPYEHADADGDGKGGAGQALPPGG